MRVLVVGGSGAIGSRLLPQLAEHGHHVTATSRSAGNAARLRSLGAEPLPLDVLDKAAVRAAVAAAGEGGVPRFIAQSFAPFRYAHTPGLVKDENDPLLADPPASARQMFAAMAYLDETVLAAGGIALRYGGFYGDEDTMVRAVRKRRPGWPDCSWARCCRS
jgi:NAD(P)-dependent dehydrogenase (short-subunit alcohol dehydrogenase family)